MINSSKKIRVLVYGDIGGSGGYVRYCKGLFGNDYTPDDFDILFVCSSQFFNQLKPLDSRIRIFNHSWPASSSRIKRYSWHLVLYPIVVSRFRPDIEFYPAGQVRTYFRKAVTITACHNLLLFDPFELTRFTDKQQRHNFDLYRNNQKNSYQKASGVIFFSDYSRKVVMKEIPDIKSSAIIPHGLEPQFRFTNSRNYDIGMQMNLLYVSSVFPYKHHLEAARGVKIAREISGKDIRLRLIGGGPANMTQQLKKTIREEEMEGFVNYLGEVDRDALIQEFTFADAFIFASSCETFGITLLEAMGARLPIVCSDRSGLPEILKDAGIYFNPYNPQSIATAITQIVGFSDTRQFLGEKAYLYSQNYTWRYSAGQTFSFIREQCKQ